MHRLADLPAETAVLISGPLADLLPSLVFVCSADGRQLYLNSRWVDYTGAGNWSSFSATRNELLPTASLVPFREPNASVSELLDGVVAPFRMRSAGGRLRWQLARIKRLGEPGEPARAWVGIVDEALSQQAAEASLSHALRTPLNSIRGWAHVLQRSGDLNETQLRALDSIEHAVRQQVLLIDELSAREHARNDAASRARAGSRAMVIGSDPQSASVLAPALRESALDPVLFADTAEAYDYLLDADAGDKPRLLIAGIGSDDAAYRFIRRVRQTQLERGEAPIRALALSEGSGADGAKQAPEGFDARLDKPIDSGQLRSTLRRLLRASPA